MLSLLANALAEARRGGGVARTSLAAPATFSQAQEVQAAVIEMLADDIAGWKAAGDSPQGFPLLAPLHASCVGPSGPLHLPSANLGIEVEFAFRFGRDLGPQEHLGGQQLLGAVAEVRICLELCRSRLPPSPALLLFVADDLANEGVVLGSGVDASESLQLGAREFSLVINGKHIRSGRTPEQESVLATLAWLTRHAAAVPGGLRAGHWAITGSLTGLTPVSSGDVVEAAIEGVGNLRYAVRK